MTIISALSNWIWNHLVPRSIREEKIRERYRVFATTLGDMLSYLHMTDGQFSFENKWYSVRDPETYHKLRELEATYSSLGYRIIPLQEWIDHGGWGASIDEYWRVPREEGERPVFTEFNVEELPAPSPILNMTIETGKSVIGVVNEDGETEYKVIEDVERDGRESQENN